MIIICAWCEKNGITNVIAAGPPSQKSAVSHGICIPHAAAFRQEAQKKMRVPRITATLPLSPGRAIGK